MILVSNINVAKKDREETLLKEKICYKSLDSLIKEELHQIKHQKKMRISIPKLSVNHMAKVEMTKTKMKTNWIWNNQL